VKPLNTALLKWFDAAKRDLPWRRTRDPYAIWISEIMCQQTQVATVIPYWERFMARFPTVESLASAPVDDVLAMWSGLGYYARARNMHKAAQELVGRHDGAFPADLEALQSLPGFGPYTAGAVGSIALGLDAALVDGNVARVLCRIQGWELGAEAAREKGWEIAPSLLPHGRAGDWNQALMEMGATVCTPANPKCDACPARRLCVAVQRGDPAQYPLPKERKPKKLMRLLSFSIRDSEGRILLMKRDAKGLFGGLWELPSVELDEAAESAKAAPSEVKAFVEGRVKLALLGRVAQALTHRDVEIDVYRVTGGKVRLPDNGRFVSMDELTSLGLSTMAVKALTAANVMVPGGHGRRKASKPGNQTALF